VAEDETKETNGTQAPEDAAADQSQAAAEAPAEAAAEEPRAAVEASADQPEDAAKAAPAEKKPARTRRAAKTEEQTDAAEADEAKAPAKPRARKAKPEAAEEQPAAEAAVAQTEAAAPVAEEKPAEKKARAPRKAAAKPAAKKPAPKAARKPAAKSGPQPGPLEGVLVDAEGNRLETVALQPDRFGVEANMGVLHLVVRAEQAARRSGSASTKTRGEIAGTTAKMYRQKGTGRARAGSVKSPVRTGGGTVFGPKPRDYTMKVNRKVVRKALAMALSNRAESGGIFVTRGLDLEQPSTRAVDQMLVGMDIPAPVLVVTDDEPVVARSVRNLGYAEVADVVELSTETVLRARSLVFTEKAFASVNEAVSS
jgi:large subunit ribosomal protein L4